MIKILLTTFLLLSIICPAAASVADSIYIKGSFSKRDTIGAVEIRCKITKSNALPNWIDYNKTYSAKIVDKEFAISIPAEEDRCYISFYIVDSKGSYRPIDLGNSYGAAFLIERGDSVSMRIQFEKKGIRFTGRGSEKLNCQGYLYMLGRLPAAGHFRYLELTNSERYDAYYNAMDTLLKVQLDMKLALLGTYQDKLPEDIYKQIYYDCVGKHFLMIYERIRSKAWILSTQKTDQLAFAKTFIRKLKEDTRDYASNPSAIISVYYTHYLLLKERVHMQFLTDGVSYLPLDVGELLATIRENYDGQIRDKLLMLCIIEWAGNGTIDHIQEVLEDMDKNESRDMLLEWQDKHHAGAPAYPFDLPDPAGRRYKLEDFKGKLVVIDFWFTGCPPCTGMAKAMAPVGAQFADDPGIVFLSINVSANKELWETGLESGKYTFPNAIHLSTAGDYDRFEHPFLKYYNYMGFPQLLLIGPNGDIVSTTPPDPRTEEGRSALIGIIEKYSGQLGPVID